MATARQIRAYLGDLTAILANYGATLSIPTLDTYPGGEVGFEIEAILPGADEPRPAVVRLVEIWAPIGRGRYRVVEYGYDLIEHPLDRRRAFHRHDEAHFLREFGVTVHQHCEERLGQPICGHYYGLPIDGYGAIHTFMAGWGQPDAFGCGDLRCLG